MALLFCTFLGEGRGSSTDFFNIFGRTNPGENAAMIEALDLGDLEAQRGMVVDEIFIQR